MTHQEIFDEVLKHLRSQAIPSFRIKDGVDKPAYRGVFNRKCAAGCLIPDCFYIPEMEGKEPHCLDFFHDHFPNQLNLIRDLQVIHDKLVGTDFHNSLSDWENAWQQVAKTYRLFY